MLLSRNLFFIFTFIFSLNCFALELKTHISDIEVFGPGDDHSLIFLASGLVAKVNSTKSELLHELQSAHKDKSLLHITMSDEREILSIRVLPDSVMHASEDNSFITKIMSDDAPTVLPSLVEARELFRYARFNHKNSQCFNRAHVWSYEWQMDKSINSAKMFIFFSVKYIREHNFHWWFHVAPYVHVVIGTEIKERIMDKKFMPGPSTLRSWIDRFMVDGTQCRTINSYSEYANYPESGICYIIRANMYTYWPMDLEMAERKGTKKEFWVPDELHTAYEEAFNIRIGGEML